MANINANFIRHDRFYHRMIGEWYIKPEEAFRVFYNFLKEFKFIGTFHYYMNNEFGSYSQNYKQYFLERVNNYQEYCNVINDIYNKPNRNGGTLYPWFYDKVLLFPFAYNNNNTFYHYGSVQYTKVEYMKGLWELYCSEQKIIESTILIENKEKDETDTGDTRLSWPSILERCGYTI